MTATHCSGCGVEAGQPRAIYRHARDVNGNWTRVARYTLPAKLESVEFLDYGKRYFCQSCCDGLRQERSRLTGRHFAIQAGRKPGTRKAESALELPII